MSLDELDCISCLELLREQEIAEAEFLTELDNWYVV